MIIGVVASLALFVPWVTSWFTKPVSTLYGVGVTGLQLGVAFVTHRGWIRSGRFGYLRAASAEQAAAAGRRRTRSSRWRRRSRSRRRTRRRRWWRCAARTRTCAWRRRAARAAQGTRRCTSSSSTEIPGLFFPPRTGPSDDALDVLDAAVKDINAEEMEAVPIWRLAHNAGRVNRGGGGGAGRALRADGDHGALGGLVVPARRRAQGAAARASRAGARGDL